MRYTGPELLDAESSLMWWWFVRPSFGPVVRALLFRDASVALAHGVRADEANRPGRGLAVPTMILVNPLGDDVRFTRLGCGTPDARSLLAYYVLRDEELLVDLDELRRASQLELPRRAAAPQDTLASPEGASDHDSVQIRRGP